MITKKDITYIADLARLELADSESESIAGHLDRILGYVAHLDSVDTRDVEPTCYVVPDHDPLRPDEPSESLAPEVLLANGPKVQGQFFAVPKVIG